MLGALTVRFCLTGLSTNILAHINEQPDDHLCVSRNRF